MNLHLDRPYIYAVKGQRQKDASQIFMFSNHSSRDFTICLCVFVTHCVTRGRSEGMTSCESECPKYWEHFLTKTSRCDRHTHQLGMGDVTKHKKELQWCIAESWYCETLCIIEINALRIWYFCKNWPTLTPCRFPYWNQNPDYTSQQETTTYFTHSSVRKEVRKEVVGSDHSMTDPLVRLHTSRKPSELTPPSMSMPGMQWRTVFLFLQQWRWAVLR